MAKGLGSSSRKGAAVGCPHQGAGTLENTGRSSARAGQTLGEAPCKGLQDVPQQGPQRLGAHGTPRRQHRLQRVAHPILV